MQCKIFRNRSGYVIVRKVPKRLDAEKRLRYEAQMLMDLPEHVNVLKLLYAQENASIYSYVQQFVYRTLFELIPVLTKRMRSMCKCMGQLLTGVQFLHSNNIIVHGLSPFTIKVDEFGIYRLGDFSWSCTFNDRLMQKSYGVLQYTAPELLAPEVSQYDERVDVWSLGCIMSQIITGQIPFNETDKETQLQTIERKLKEERFVESHKVYFKIKTILGRMLTLDYNDRPRSNVLIEDFYGIYVNM